MYFLLDANVTAAYYLPRSMKSTKASSRIEGIFDSVRSGGSSHFFYIPNFCIAEVVSVFMKYAYSSWNGHVASSGGTVDKRVYNSLVKQFSGDIHNARFIYHYELSRYHVLAINLVAPIDHYFRLSHGNKRPMGTFDHLIAAMGIHLAHIHGRDKVAILTADKRLADVMGKCRTTIPAKTRKRLKLNIAEEVTGRPFSANLFPQCINLASAKKSELISVLGVWPPPKGNKAFKAYRWLD